MMITLTLIDYAQLYALAGLITLFVLVRMPKSPDEWIDFSDHLGKAVLMSILGWPYVLVIWVFSWKVWLRQLKIPAVFCKFPYSRWIK